AVDFFHELFVVLPGWTATRGLFAAWNLAALALIAWWSYKVGHGARDASTGWFLAASVAAISSFCTTLRNGQLGILVIALVLASMLLEEKNRHVAAGLLLGAAMIKPTIAGPFAIAFLVRRRFSALFAAAAYVAV